MELGIRLRSPKLRFTQIESRESNPVEAIYILLNKGDPLRSTIPSLEKPAKEFLRLYDQDGNLMPPIVMTNIVALDLQI